MSSSNLGGARQAGVRSSASETKRRNAIAAIKAEYGLSEFIDLFPASTQPTSELGCSAILNLKAIAVRVTLPRLHQLMLGECARDGVLCPVSFKHTAAILAAVKASETANAAVVSAPTSVPAAEVPAATPSRALVAVMTSTGKDKPNPAHRQATPRDSPATDNLQPALACPIKTSLSTATQSTQIANPGGTDKGLAVKGKVLPFIRKNKTVGPDSIGPAPVDPASVASKLSRQQQQQHNMTEKAYDDAREDNNTQSIEKGLAVLQDESAAEDFLETPKSPPSVYYSSDSGDEIVGEVVEQTVKSIAPLANIHKDQDNVQQQHHTEIARIALEATDAAARITMDPTTMENTAQAVSTRGASPSEQPGPPTGNPLTRHPFAGKRKVFEKRKRSASTQPADEEDEEGLAGGKLPRNSASLGESRQRRADMAHVKETTTAASPTTTKSAVSSNTASASPARACTITPAEVEAQTASRAAVFDDFGKALENSIANMRSSLRHPAGVKSNGLSKAVDDSLAPMARMVAKWQRDVRGIFQAYRR